MSDEDRIAKTAAPARTGAIGPNVRNVLVICLVGAILLLIGFAALTLH